MGDGMAAMGWRRWDGGDGMAAMGWRALLFDRTTHTAPFTCPYEVVRHLS